MPARITALALALATGAAAAADYTRTLATRSHDLAFGLAAGADGTIYAGTIFHARFDARPHGGTGAFAPQGRNDSWVFALDAAGRPRWARPIAGPGTTELRDLAVLTEGRVVAAGYFSGALSIGPREGERAGAVAGADAFVAAFEADGAPAFVRGFGGKGADAAFALAPLATGFVVVGSFEHAMRLGEVGTLPRVLRSSGRRDAFVARLGADGRVLAAEALGGPNDDRAVAVASAPDGGYAVLVLHRGGIEHDGSAIAASGADDALVLRFDASGRRVASATLAHSGPDAWDAIAVASDGAVWVGGQFVGAPRLALGGREQALRSAGSSDVALVVFEPTLERARVHTLGNEGADTLARLAPAARGAMYVAGSGVGALELGHARYDAPGPRAWIARVAPDGRILSSSLFEAEGITQATALAALDRRRVAVLGLYEKALVAPGDGQRAALGKTDAFVAVRKLAR